MLQRRKGFSGKTRFGWMGETVKRRWQEFGCNMNSIWQTRKYCKSDNRNLPNRF